MSTLPERTWTFLEPRPGSSYRQLFIKGTKITARTLYGEYLNGEGPSRMPEEVAADWDLPVEAVREAISYCESDPPEIRADWEADKAYAEATGMGDPNIKFHSSPKLLSLEERAQLMARIQGIYQRAGLNGSNPS